MRQAWGAVATASCDVSALNWQRQALAVMDYLAPGMFTVVLPAGREVLVELAGIAANRGKPTPLVAVS